MTIIKNNIVGSEFWVNSEDTAFRDILIESRVPGKWSKFSYLEKEFKDSVIKPINRYVSNLYPRPKLMSVKNNIVTLRQSTHAEIWVEPQGEDLYALDKTWQRQFYPSNKRFEDADCFNPTYKFYIPWMPDIDGLVKITNCLIDNPVFIIKEEYVELQKLNTDEEFIDVQFVHFKIKKDGPHMKTEEYGIIDMHTPMYDMSIELSDQEVENVRRQFG